jgi:lipopolysaccharide export system permease protein
VPIGFFLAIMLALGRLYHESEMAAIQSCGVGPPGLYRPIGALGVAIFALLSWLSFWAIPQAAARALEIRAEALRDAQFGALEPGRFRTFADGAVVFYAERVDDNGVLHNVHVFIDRPASAPPAEKDPGAGPTPPQEDKVEVWVATRAQQRGAGQAEQTFVLYDGERYEGAPGSGEFRITEFAEGGIPIRLGEINGTATKPEMKPTRELLASNDPRDAAELQWRISTPLLSLILMVMAVPLARLRPRQGRFGRIGIAILAFFLYYQALVAARTWVETQGAFAILGVWWVHALALCVGVVLLAREAAPGALRFRLRSS